MKSKMTLMVMAVGVILGMRANVPLESGEPSLLQWRMAVATNGFAVVEHAAAVPQDVRQAIWESYREQVGYEGVQISRPRLVSTNEVGAVYDLPFRIGDGARYNYGVSVVDGNVRPLYLTADKMAAGDVTDTALAVLSLGGTTNNVITWTPRLLDVQDAVLSKGQCGHRVELPFDRFFVFVSDDMPLADWRHPTRFLFVSEDTKAFAVMYADEPLEVAVGGNHVQVEVLRGGASVLRNDSAPHGKRLMASTPSEFPAITDGDASNCHVLLVSGGYNIANNHCRYWNEMCFVYNVMRKRFGVPRKNIKVLWANGNPASDLCRNGTCTSRGNPCRLFAFETSNLSDFDLDGNNDINGAATLANVRTVLSSYASSLTGTDQLLVFFSDHGGYYGGKKGNKATVCLWGEDLLDTEFASLTKNIKCPVMAALKTCYSGGMVQEFVDASANRMMATADRYDPSLADPLMGDWTYYFFSALCGYYPYGSGPKPTYYSDKLDPRHVGSRCDADLDGDGRVSFYEAHQFACKMNPFVGDDVPQYDESTANLGKKMFMTMYADVSPVTVKEKVMTPTLNPSSGTLGYAPCSVTASCGTAGATIRYTLDGSEPTASSAVYSGGITITKDTTVTVRAFKSWWTPSDSASAAYTTKKSAPKKALITSVSQGDTPAGIVVNWVRGEGASSYDVLRSETSSMQNPVVVTSALSAETFTFMDSSVAPGKAYYYRIRAVNEYGNTLSETSSAAYRKLTPPSVAEATVNARVNTSTVALRWEPSPGATHYKVYRKTEDGTVSQVTSGWQGECSFTDAVAMNNSYFRIVSYMIQASTSSYGDLPSDMGRSYPVRIDASLSGKEIMFSKERPGTLAFLISSTMDSVMTASFLEGGMELPGDPYRVPLEIRLQPSSSAISYYCYVLDTNKLGESNNYGTPGSISFSLVSGAGKVSISRSTDSFGYPVLKITPLSPTTSAPAVIRATISSSTAKKSRDINVYVSSAQVIRSLNLGDVPSCLAAGERVGLSCLCGNVGGGLSTLPAGMDVEWSAVKGEGVELEDDEICVHQLSAKKTAVIQAAVQTSYGRVVATKEITLLPKMPQQETEIRATGGATTVYVGQLPSVAHLRFPTSGWINGISVLYSDDGNIGNAVTYNIGTSGMKTLALKGKYCWLSFSAERNAGKSREQVFPFRYEGGGVDCVIRQDAAPVANTPVVFANDGGVVSAGATSDGSSLRYAIDGEEPSSSSPVFARELVFDYDTDVAVKAFGDWMQASDTVYVDVAGKDSRWDEIEISFVPGQPGLAVPAKRTYRVNEKFGALPSFKKTNGLYFKGWTLNEGSDKLVSSTDGVPSQSATVFAVWSPVEEDKPQWTALPWNFKSAITATMKVYDDTTGTYLDPSVCIIGIEDADGVCRGSSENGFGDMQSELNGKNGLYVFGVYSPVENGTEAGLKIRIWNKEKGFMLPLNGDISFSAAGTLGNETSPYVVHVVSGYKVTFNANGGVTGESVRMVAENTAVGRLPKPTRAGCGFDGWYTSKSGGVKVSAATKVVADVTYYAHWRDVGAVELATTCRVVSEAVDSVEFTVRRLAPDGHVRIRYATQSGEIFGEKFPARPGEDYYPADGILEWADGDMSDKTVRIRLVPDLVPTWEGSFKKFWLTFWPMEEAGLLDDEFPAVISGPSEAYVKIKESDVKTPGSIVVKMDGGPYVTAGKDFRCRIVREGGADGIVAVDVRAINGTALSGTDYEPSSQTIVWADGETSPKVFVVRTKSSTTFDAERKLSIKMTVSGGDGYETPDIPVVKTPVWIVNDKVGMDFAGFSADALEYDNVTTAASGTWYMDDYGRLLSAPVAEGAKAQVKFTVDGPGIFVAQPQLVGPGTLTCTLAGETQECHGERLALAVPAGRQTVTIRAKNGDGTSYVRFAVLDDSWPYKWLSFSDVAAANPTRNSVVRASTLQDLTWSVPYEYDTENVWYRVRIGSRAGKSEKIDHVLAVTRDTTCAIPEAYALENGKKYWWMLDYAWSAGAAPAPDSPDWIKGPSVWPFQTAEAGASETTVAPFKDAFEMEMRNDATVNLVQGVFAQVKLTDAEGEADSLALVRGELPPGMELKANVCKLKGTPTTPGDYEMLLQVTSGGKPALTRLVKIHVAPLGLAIGSFTGVFEEAGSRLTNNCPRVGSLQFSAGVDGTIAAKVKIAGKVERFTASRYGMVNEYSSASIDTYKPDSMLVAMENTRLVNGVVYTNTLEVCANTHDDNTTDGWAYLVWNAPDGRGVQEGVEYVCDLYRNNADLQWRVKEMAAFAGYYTVAFVPETSVYDGCPAGYGYLTLTVAENGAVQFAGRLADGTEASGSAKARLIDVYDGGWKTQKCVVPLCFMAPPVSFGGRLTLRREGDAAGPVVENGYGSAFSWNRDGETASYDGCGFGIAVNPAGGWYDTVLNLQRHYLDYALSFGTEPLVGLPQDMLPDGYAFTPSTLPSGVAVNILGNSLSVQAAMPPVKEDGSETRYDLAASVNPWATTLNFTRATGIVSGKFKIWGDDGVSQRKSAYYRHYGVMLLNMSESSPLDGSVLTAGFGLVGDMPWFSIPFCVRSAPVENDWSEHAPPEQ